MKELICRAALFFAAVYFVIPWIFKILEKRFISVFQFNFFSFAIFTLLLIVLFVGFNRKELTTLKPKINTKETILSLNFAFAAFLCYFWIKFFSFGVFQRAPEFFVMLSYIAYLSGACFLGVASFGVSFFKRFYSTFLAAGILVWIFFQFSMLLQQNWKFFSGAVAKSVYFLLGANAKIMLGVGDPVLSFNNFSVVIGSPCSGIESLAMFTVLFTCILVFEWARINKDRILPVFSIGLIGMFGMSIVRIWLLMVVGNVNPNLALTLFHSNLGWLIFVVYFLAYVRISWRFLVRQ